MRTKKARRGHFLKNTDIFWIAETIQIAQMDTDNFEKPQVRIISRNTDSKYVAGERIFTHKAIQ